MNAEHLENIRAALEMGQPCRCSGDFVCTRCKGLAAVDALSIAPKPAPLLGEAGEAMERMSRLEAGMRLYAYEYDALQTVLTALTDLQAQLAAKGTGWPCDPSQGYMECDKLREQLAAKKRECEELRGIITRAGYDEDENLCGITNEPCPHPDRKCHYCEIRIAWDARAESAEASRDGYKARCEELDGIAKLIALIFVYGDFKAETNAERELEMLLRKHGYWWNSIAERESALATEVSNASL